MSTHPFSLKCPFHTFVAGALATVALWKLFGLLHPTKKTLTIERFDVDNRYSDAIRYNDVVYVCGQVNTEGNTIEEQTMSALKYVDAALAKAGTDKSKILDVTIFLADLDKDYDGMNSVYDKWIAPGKPPCRACIQAKLATASYRVEFKVVAAA